jgi:hypothetical protein
LKRRTLNSGEEIPLDEYELLEQYTFWVREWNRELTIPFF